jgi:dTDP-glucose 4,6-dehydratase
VARVVVTGGAGFVGSHLCDALLARGDQVVCLDSLLTGRVSNIEHLFTHDTFTFARTDVTQHVWVPGDVDVVMHLASPASPVDFGRLPIEILKVGAMGTHNALGLAKQKGAKFFLASTSEVYGDPTIHPQPETYWGNVNPIGPRSVYDEAKRFAEAMTMAYHKAEGIDVRIVRIFNTYGPRMRADDGRVVSNFITQALRGEPLTIYGDGSQTRSFCYVDDQVRGHLALLDATATGPINIGNDTEWSMLQLAELVIDVTNSDSSIEFHPRPTDDPVRRRPDLTRARRELGWAPRVELRDGIARTAAAFLAQSEVRAPGTSALTLSET